MKKAAASRRTKSGGSKREYEAVEAVGEAEVTIDRRRGSRRNDEPAVPANAAESATPAPKLERREKVNRRRQIDPTTCERDYTDDEVE
jgi:hypothetical protein